MPNFEEQDNNASQIKDVSNLKQDLKDVKLKKYAERLNLVQKDLYLKEKRPAEIEALLIKATEDKFENETLKTDSVLVSLGLVKGYGHYGHNNFDSKKYPVTERYKKFLHESSYISAESEYTPYSSYEEAADAKEKSKKKDGTIVDKEALEIIRSTLGTNVGRWIEEVANYLICVHENNQLSDYLSEAAKKYPSTNPDHIPDNELPPLRNPRQEFNGSNPPETSNGINIDKEKRKFDLVEFFNKVAKRLSVFLDGLAKKIVLILNVTYKRLFAFFFCAFIVYILWQNYSKKMHNENVIGQLYLSETINKADGIHLKPDESKNYTMSVYPPESNANSAEIEILDHHVAMIFLDPFPSSALNQRYITIKAQKEWDEKNHTTKITISGNDIKDEKISVTVDKPDVSTSNENNTGIFNVYEGDEGSRQKNKPMN